MVINWPGHKRASAFLQLMAATVLLLLPLTSAIYLHALAIAPLAYLATVLFIAMLMCLAGPAIAVHAGKVHPDYPCTRQKTTAPDRTVYCPLGLYVLGNAVLLGCVLHFNNRVKVDLQMDLTQSAVGAVSDSSARIWVRAPSHSVACIAARSKDNHSSFAEWSVIDSNADYTTVVTLVGLRASTEYIYTVTACATGGASLAGGTVLLGAGEFRTFPDRHVPIAGDGTPSIGVRFAMGSCTMIGRTAYRAMQGIRRVHDADPDFYLFLGDAIYADVPQVSNGLGSGSTALYHSMYRETFANRDFASLRASTPGFYQIDDHEILNDFELDAKTMDLYSTATTAWKTYVGSMNPTPPAPTETAYRHHNESDIRPLYYSFQAGPLATVFVLDTRSYRYRAINQTTVDLVHDCEWRGRSIESQHGDGTMIGKHQGAAVRRWLQESQDAGIAFKFLSSPQPWSRNVPPRGRRCSEGWSGHLGERDALLDWIDFTGITGVVFLSGDLHQCGVYELRKGMFEITASPFDASGQITDHAPGKLDATIFSQHHYNQAFALITVDDEDDRGENAVQPRQRQVKLEIYQGGTTMIYEIVEAAFIVSFSVLLLVVGPLVHLARPGGLMGCWREPAASLVCWLLAPLVAFIAVLVAAPTGDEFTEPRFAATISETGEITTLL